MDLDFVLKPLLSLRVQEGGLNDSRGPKAGQGLWSMQGVIDPLNVSSSV